MQLPLVSIVICTLNCRDYTRRCLESIRAQDYPQEKIEIVIVDSYSTDGTIEVARELGARVILTEIRGYMEGKGMPKSIGCNSAKGDIIITIDSDNAMVEKTWLRNMVRPLMTDPSVNICICRQWIDKNDPLINRYVSLIGTDPFASYCSVDSQLALKRLPLVDQGDYYTYRITADNFFILGGYYLTFRRSTLEEIGGYTRDVDVITELARRGKANVAIVKNTHLHHLITRSTRDFFRKKLKWGTYYFSNKDPHRTHKWADGVKGKTQFAYQVVKKLLFVPALIESFWLVIRDREKAWLLHAPITWLTTSAYILAFFKVKGRMAFTRLFSL
jgi:glycosyltransferase involved in cell wall biosynthesis